jgi:hypothetical protein
MLMVTLNILVWIVRDGHVLSDMLGVLRISSEIMMHILGWNAPIEAYVIEVQGKPAILISR